MNTRPPASAAPVDGLVERLRLLANGHKFQAAPVCTEAADQLTVYARRVAELEGALKLHRKFEAVAAEVLDEADNVIAINCGTDTPKEWNKAFRRFAIARAALTGEKG